MPTSRKTRNKDSVGRVPTGEKTYPTEKLLKSRHLAGYQPDFARVILTEARYTVSDAKDRLEEALKRKER